MAEHHSAAIVVRLADPPPSPGPTLAGLWKPYVYRGLGFDIYDPDEEDDDEAAGPVLRGGRRGDGLPSRRV
jgi:hypothetical protein